MFGNFIVSLILTVFGYLFVPVLLVIKGKKYPKKKLKRIAVINGLLVWLAISIIVINAGGEAGAGGILWIFVGYWLMKKNCLEEETEEKGEQS